MNGFTKVLAVIENAAPVAMVNVSLDERDGEFKVFATASDFQPRPAFDATRGTATALFQFPQMHRPEDKGAVIGFQVAEDFGVDPVIVRGSDLASVVEAFGLAVANRLAATLSSPAALARKARLEEEFDLLVG